MDVEPTDLAASERATELVDAFGDTERDVSASPLYLFYHLPSNLVAIIPVKKGIYRAFIHSSLPK